MEELKKEIIELQNQMAIAVENDDVTQAHQLEMQIEELQQQLIRLQAK